MLAAFRRFAKSPWATGLFVILLGSFVVFGVRGYVGATFAPDAVIKAGDRKVTGPQFRAIFQRYLQQAAQQNGGQSMSIPQAAAQGLDVRALSEVAYEESTAALITRLGVRPGDPLVAAELAKFPQLRDPVSGRFDKRAYADFLRQNNLTAQELEGSFRDQIAQQQFLTGLVAGLEAPYAYTSMVAAFNGERRSFDYVSLAATSVPPPAKPTEAELQAFMKANAAGLTRPEVRTVSLVRFSAGQLAATVTVSPADLQKRFEFEKDSLSTPEKRSFTEIPLTSAAQGEAAAARLRKGEDPAAVARSLGVQPVVLADAPQSAVPDPAVAKAAFAMAPGEVRVVSGGLATAVVKLSAVTPGHAATLDEARPKLEDEVRKAAAAEKAHRMADAYDDARNGGADLAVAAQKAGATITPLPPFTAQGADARGQHIAAPEKLIKTAYALPQGGVSELLTAAPGEYYAIKVEKVAPAGPLTLDEVREPLTRRLTLQKLVAALQAKATAISAQARKEGFDAAAKAAGLAVQHAQDVARSQPPPAPGQPPPPAPFGPEVLAAVFGAKPGEIVSAPDKAALVVARVAGVTPAATPTLVQAGVAARQNVTLGLYQELIGHTREAARSEIKPVVNAKLARSALGLEAAAPGAPAS